MTFNNYNTSNNAICLLNTAINSSSTVVIAKGNYERFPISNGKILITEYNEAQEVVGREIMDYTSRVGTTFNISARATEEVALNDSANELTQDALDFPADSIIEVVMTAGIIEDIQDEVTDLGSRVTTTEGDITTLEDDKADKTNVLELDNTTAYTPTADYHPATKKFVLDQGVDIDGMEASTSIPETSKFPFYNADNTRNETTTTDELRQEMESIQYLGVTASDTLQASADTERSENIDSQLSKKKEIKISENYTKGGTVRVKVESRATGTLSFTQEKVKLYKNGVFVDNFNSGDLTTSYVQFTLDVSVSPGDLIQCYILGQNSAVIFIRDFRIYYNEVEYTKTPTINLD